MPSKMDPANYRKMSEPLPEKETSENLQKFMEAVEKLRNEFHMQDVHVIVKMSILREDGTEGAGMSSAHFGHALEAGVMCAWSLGREEVEYKHLIQGTMKQD